MTDPQLNRVELRPAFEWTCDQCGLDNFERMITRELSEDERRQVIEENDIDPDEEDEYIMSAVAQPIHVICGHCGSHFETEPLEETNGDEYGRLP